MNPPVKYDLLRDGERLFRVLWSDPFGPQIVVLEVTRATAWPEFRNRSDVMDDLNAGALTYEAYRDPRNYTSDADLSSLHMKYRDAAWSLIKDFVEDEPAAYNKKLRCVYIHSVVAERDIAWNAVARYMKRYWHFGMTKNALLPRFFRCGAPKTRRAETSVRRGRPRRVGHPIGVNTTLEHRRLFTLAIKDYYAKNRKLTLEGAYQVCIQKFFSDKIVGKNGRIEHVAKAEFAERGFPSYGAFIYWVKEDRFTLDVQRKRETARIYEMKNRPLTGSTTKQAPYPSMRFQIDATIADIYLVSCRDPNQLIGRPVVYVIIDEFSRLIVGLYIGLEGPSYAGAMMALANAVAPKKAYCASFGIEIDEEDWPARHLPTALLADRGELKGIGIEEVLDRFHIVPQNTPPYRGDWKGLIERQFGAIHSGFKPYTPGYIECDFRQRGARDYRGDAVLTLEDFTKIVIDMILHYNTFHVLEDYERAPALTEDGVKSIPLELWRWGIANIGGLPKSPAPELVRFALMQTARASVTEHGILFNKLYYTCDLAMKEKWFAKARLKRFPVEISYDKRDASRVYVHTPKSAAAFEVARLASKSDQYDGLSGWEVASLQKADAALHANFEMTERLERAGVVSRMEQTVAKADERQKAAGSGSSLAQRTKGVRANRAVEKAVRREAEASAFRPDATEAKPGLLLPFVRPDAPEAAEYAKPSISFLKRQVDSEDES